MHLCTFSGMHIVNNRHSFGAQGESRLPYAARPSTILVDAAGVAFLAGSPIGLQLRVMLRAHRAALVLQLAKLPMYVNVRYQDPGIPRVRLTFRPDPESWHELRQFSRTFNVSICFVVTLLLDLARRGVGTPSGMRVPPKLMRSLEIFSFERFALYSGRIHKSFSIRIPPEIVQSPMFPFWPE